MNKLILSLAMIAGLSATQGFAAEDATADADTTAEVTEEQQKDKATDETN